MMITIIIIIIICPTLYFTVSKIIYSVKDFVFV